MSEAAVTGRLGSVGIWAPQLRSRDRGKIRDVAAGLDELGYGTLWVPGGWAGDLLSDMSAVLGASSRAVVASAVLNIWVHEAKETAAWLNRMPAESSRRVLLGLGVSHPQRVAAMGQTYRAMPMMRGYLDDLDRASPPVGPDRRVLAALGPKMLELARERSAGVHTYLVNPAHTATARAVLGPGRLVAPEVKVILDDDRTRAVETARAHIAHYLGLENYAHNLLRSGYEAADLESGGSLRLLDGLFAIGDVDAARRRVLEHREAGADHVCVQVVTAERGAVPWAEWRRLADALL